MDLPLVFLEHVDEGESELTLWALVLLGLLSDDRLLHA